VSAEERLVANGKLNEAAMPRRMAWYRASDGETMYGYLVSPAELVKLVNGGLEHPHDGYAYDGCGCVCCLNVRLLAEAPR
jgi:hypothetical protein